MLPLHGAPLLIDTTAVAARRDINRRLDHFIERGSPRAQFAQTPTPPDVIVFTALLTQPVRHEQDWERMSARQRRLFLDGMATPNPPMPGS